MQLEGIISKRRDAPYRSSKQCGWVQVCDVARGKQRTVATVRAPPLTNYAASLASSISSVPTREANCLCHFVDTDPLGKLGSCLAQLVWIAIRTAEALFDLAVLRDEMALTFDLVLGALQPSIDARADHRALELGESARELKHELARRRRGVNVLLIEIQVDAAGFEVLDCAQ